MSEENKIKITPAKGRPMLYWVGKKPLDYVKGFPAQLVEVFDPLNTGRIVETPTYDELKDNWQNLLFHGDNKDVLATLLEKGFRGKIDLIYIDPPFSTNKDYVRKVELRGLKSLGKMEEDDASVLQQIMYEDLWKRDEYFQFMYERLMLLRELLSETGSIFVHLNDEQLPYIKLLMDEVFLPDNYRNTILLRNINKNLQIQFKGFSKMNRYGDFVLWYSKDPNAKFKPPTKEFFRKGYWHVFSQPADRPTLRYDLLGVKISTGQWMWKKERAYKAVSNYKEYLDKFADKIPFEKYAVKHSDLDFIRLGPTGVPEYYIRPSKETICDTLWDDIIAYEYGASFTTKKSENLLYRIITFASNPDDIVLDCFIGSGTTARVARKLGRRWIGCDINKGAVHLTSRELQKIINEQVKESKTKYPTFAIYKVNDYDLKLLKTEAIELAVQHIGIQRSRTDRFFDGTLGKNIVKIIDFNHPLTLLDLQLLADELKKRPDEDRDITIVCLGKELAVDPWIGEWNKKHPVNKIRVIELKTDKKYGNFLIHRPAEAKVNIKRRNNKAIVEIKDFISPTIIERLNIDNKLFKVKIPDFRSMIDCVLIDNNYDGSTFHIVYSDIPKTKNDLVEGKYELEISKNKIRVAVKIIDMLGEEVLFVKAV